MHADNLDVYNRYRWHGYDAILNTSRIIMSKNPCEKFKQLNNFVTVGIGEFSFILAFDEIIVLANALLQSIIE